LLRFPNYSFIIIRCAKNLYDKPSGAASTVSFSSLITREDEKLWPTFHTKN
jgi:hypothetical protein